MKTAGYTSGFRNTLKERSFWAVSWYCQIQHGLRVHLDHTTVYWWAVDEQGHTVDFYLSQTRISKAGMRLLGKDLQIATT